MKELVLPLMLSLTPFTTIGATETYVCDYPRYSDIKGAHSSKEKFELTFVVDRSKGTAYAVGSQGSAEVKMLAGNNQLIFIEITGTGNITTTTIISGGESVHSRNIVIAGKIVASQNYGKCVLK